MTVISDSGPLIHLALVEQFSLLKRYFSQLVIIPQVYEEVAVQGQGRPGDMDLRAAIREG